MADTPTTPTPAPQPAATPAQPPAPQGLDERLEAAYQAHTLVSDPPAETPPAQEEQDPPPSEDPPAEAQDAPPQDPAPTADPSPEAQPSAPGTEDKYRQQLDQNVSAITRKLEEIEARLTPTPENPNPQPTPADQRDLAKAKEILGKVKTMAADGFDLNLVDDSQARELVKVVQTLVEEVEDLRTANATLQERVVPVAAKSEREGRMAQIAAAYPGQDVEKVWKDACQQAENEGYLETAGREAAINRATKLMFQKLEASKGTTTPPAAAPAPQPLRRVVKPAPGTPTTAAPRTGNPPPTRVTVPTSGGDPRAQAAPQSLDEVYARHKLVE